MALRLYVGWTLIALAFGAAAFYPLPEASPEWMLRTRSVCFGTLENGLPDAGGWLMVLGAPLTMLAALLVLHGEDLRRDLRDAWGRPAGRVGLVLLFLSPLWGIAWVGHRVARGLAVTASAPAAAPTPLPEHYPRLDLPIADFQLVDQHGQAVTPATFQGKVTLLTFAFAHCRTVCPVMLNQVLRAAKETGAEVMVVTLDPYRDTPSSLASQSKGWGLPENGRLVSGAPDDVNAWLDAMNVSRSRDMKTGNINHPALVYLVAPDGRIAYAFNDAPAAWLAEGVKRVTR